MTPDELDRVLATLWVNQTKGAATLEELATFLGTTPRQLRRWRFGGTPIPVAVAKLLWLMHRDQLTTDEVDQCCNMANTRTAPSSSTKRRRGSLITARGKRSTTRKSTRTLT